MSPKAAPFVCAEDTDQPPLMAINNNMRIQPLQPNSGRGGLNCSEVLIFLTRILRSLTERADNECMDEQERELMRRWVETWKRAGPELEAIRRREVRDADNLQVLEILEDAFNDALERSPPRQSSGIVE